MPEWLKGADCKSAGVRLRWFESNSLHHCCFSSENKKTYTTLQVMCFYPLGHALPVRDNSPAARQNTQFKFKHVNPMRNVGTYAQSQTYIA